MASGDLNHGSIKKMSWEFGQDVINTSQRNSDFKSGTAFLRGISLFWSISGAIRDDLALPFEILDELLAELLGKQFRGLPIGKDALVKLIGNSLFGGIGLNVVK